MPDTSNPENPRNPNPLPEVPEVPEVPQVDPFPKAYVDQTLTEKRLLDVSVNVEKLIGMVGMLESGLDNKLNAFLTTLQIHLNMPGAPSAKPQPHAKIQDAEIVETRKPGQIQKRDYRRA